MTHALWAVACYFNPLGSARRRANFHAFRRALRAPLLLVEWSPTGDFELSPGDADRMVRVAGGDLMWQKERLLNLGIARLPDTCRHVAWLDADVVFARDDWADEAVRRLAHVPVVQLYDRVHCLAPQPLDGFAQPHDWIRADAELVRTGAIAALGRAGGDAGPRVTDDLGEYALAPSKGFAWAAHRTLLLRHPLPDTWVVGGGDSVFFHAVTGSAADAVSRHRLSAAHRARALLEARALHRATGGRVDHVPGTIAALWHGALADRRYRSRHEILAAHGFEPARHLRPAPQGAWTWSGEAGALRDAVRRYFEQRREDGAPQVDGSAGGRSEAGRTDAGRLPHAAAGVSP